MSSNYNLILHLGVVSVELEKILNIDNHAVIGTVKARIQFFGKESMEAVLFYDTENQRFVDYLGDYDNSERTPRQESVLENCCLSMDRTFARLYNGMVIERYCQKGE